MLVNLLLLRGNIGKPGAGICPMRGHSNVQGQRTVGITEKPELAPLDRLAELYGFEPPRDKGCQHRRGLRGDLRDGTINAFIGLGGNFVRAMPDTTRWSRRGRQLRAHRADRDQAQPQPPGPWRGRLSLPCLGRIEIDEQASGAQASRSRTAPPASTARADCAEPASEHLCREPAIVAGIAKATLRAETAASTGTRGSRDYALVRDAIERDLSRHQFQRFQPAHVAAGRLSPADCPRASANGRRKTGKANFITPRNAWRGHRHAGVEQRDVLQLITLRSNGQFNTTVYGYDDRFRGVHGTRMVVLMHRDDMARFGLAEGDAVTLTRSTTVAGVVSGSTVVSFDIPAGCVTGYYPECNPLIPLSHHAKGSKVPAAKSIPVRVIGTQSNKEAIP